MALWPIDLVSVGQVTSGAIAWRRGAQRGVTLVVKATFALVHGGQATLAAPVEVTRLDRHHDRSPLRSVERASDLAIYRPAADVTFVGHAHAPPGRPTGALSVRIGVFRDRDALLDKTLHVFGDRDLAGGRPSSPRPFQRMPVVYERAIASAENPVGIAASTGKAPNVVDPRDLPIPAGLGPVSRYWPQRRDLLRNVDRKRFEASEPEIDEAFPWAYFQAAPPDQRIALLRGDEWIVLDGLHPALARMQTQLPALRGVARVTTFSPAPQTRPVDLVADTLAVDGDALTVSIVWRAPVPVSGEAELAAMRAYLGVEVAGNAVAWPDPHALPPPSLRPPPGGAARAPAPADLGHTRDLSVEDATVQGPSPLGARRAAVLPFVTPAPPVIVDDPTVDGPSPLGARHTAVLPFVAPAPPAAGDATAEGPSPLGGRGGADVPFAPFPIASPTAPDAPQRSAAIPWLEPRGPAAPPPRSTLATMELTSFDLPPPIPIAPPSEPRAAAPAPAASGGDAARWFHVAPRAEAGPLPEPTGIEPPRRRSPAIPIVNGTPLAVATMPWQMKPPQDSLTIIVKGTFDLVPSGPAALRAESDLPVGDLHLDDDEERSLRYGSDFAVWKPRADVTVTGRAHAPSAATPAAHVELRFGEALRRRIAVLGDRRWQRALVAVTQTAAEPFESMPLVWERAYGGPKHDPNPAGAGHKSAPGDALPNLEDPAHLIASPGDTPPPACLAPVPITWRERASRLGTYGGRYLATRWPYFPEDFDWGYFQTAPAAQQVEHLQGDERYAITGMHPLYTRIEGTLPGVRPRCFVHRTREAGGGFGEVSLRLDTAAFDMDEVKVNLVWRGILDVTDDEAPEINAIFVMVEEPGATPATLEEARARYLAEATPPPDPEDEPAPKPPPAVANDVEETEPDDGGEAEMDAHEKKVLDDLRAAGVPEADLAAPADPPPPPDPEAMAASLRDLGADEEDVAGLLAALQPPPPDEADEVGPAPAEVRARVIAMLAQGEPLAGLDLAGADLSELDFSGRSLAGANLKGARLRSASLARADLAGALLEGADLTGARLDEANLEGADLVRATLTGASLAGAILRDADAGGARGEGAIFDGAKAERAQLAGGVWGGARFDGAELGAADFSGSTLDGASFRGAGLAEARFYDVRGTHVVFDDARMPGARAEGATLTQSSLRGVSAPGSVWESATLDESTFHGADLKGASLSRASCRGTIFAAADLGGARLRRARLHGASFLKANLMAAILERADLTLADLRGANLHTAETWKARLDDARLDLAIVTQSKLAKEQRK